MSRLVHLFFIAIMSFPLDGQTELFEDDHTDHYESGI
jgi:hypothetical protein